MTKQELVDLYNNYLKGELTNEQEGDLWEGLYDFSNSFLCYIHCSNDTKEDSLEDLIYDLMTMNKPFKQVKDFNGLVNVLVSKLKTNARKYNNWENKCLDEGATGEFQDSVSWGSWKVKHDRGKRG